MFAFSKGAVVASLMACAISGVAQAEAPREVVHEVVVAAPRAVVWSHWTTLDGLQAMFTATRPPLHGAIDLRANGPYELYFLSDNAAGERGGEGARIIAYEEQRMLSFTWRNTPFVPSIRPFFTHVMLTLEEIDADTTRVRLQQTGFGDGDDWDQCFAYFDEQWSRVLARLAARYGDDAAMP